MSRFDNRSRVSTYIQSWVSGEPDFGAFESIATTTVGPAGASTVTFNNIPQTYKHLQIRCISRSAGTETVEGGLLMVYASPHANNAYWHRINGNGATATSANSGGESYSTFVSFITKSTDTASVFGVAILDILDYADTNKTKTYRSIGGWDSNGSGNISMGSGLNRDASAITSIALALNSGSNFVQYSSFALYGIKG